MSEQRSRVVAATAVVFAGERPPTVAAVAKVARVSRNTFYEYFDDIEHARAAAALRAHQRLEATFKGAQLSRTPVERWRELTRAWFGWVLASPAEARLLTASDVGGLSPAGCELEAAFTRSLSLVRASGLNAPSADAVRVTAVAAAGEVLARALAAEELAAADVNGHAPELQRRESALVDIAVRLLR